MTYNEAKAKCRNPGAFSSGDRWMVKDSTTNEPVEGAKTERAAAVAAEICNTHEEKHKRPRVYVVEALETGTL